MESRPLADYFIAVIEAWKRANDNGKKKVLPFPSGIDIQIATLPHRIENGEILIPHSEPTS